jgi:hypothetical protein
VRRALVAAILFYRRRLSGRGPLRKVRCTFGHCESCSAYGLRAAREAPTVREAIGRIRRRLRRCRDASVYALVAPDGGRALAWGDDLDRPIDELIASLETADELPPARATVLAAREAVARWRGDLVDRMAVAAHRRGLPRASLMIRPAPSRRALVGRRTRRALLAAPLLVALAWWLLPLSLPVALTGVTVALAALVVRPSARLAQIDRQARAAALAR